MDDPVRALRAELRGRLPQLMVRDERGLRRRLDGARTAEAIADVAAGIATAEQRVERRRAAVPDITYPPALPVSQGRDDLLAAIRDHQVVIVAGETGSGKTTQLPKLCLELGRGVRGLIGHTQPRRLAARTNAERIAAELGGEVGGAVGYAVRFTDRTHPDTLVKLMTDGILLTEIPHDRQLLRYDTLIIDEAHERSLNIDFLLGYLRQLLPRRRDLKVLITSATIDPQRFSHHFDDAPVVEVSGRMYPVEVRYRPVGADGDQTDAIASAVAELCAEGPGDILVFLSGEREIRDTADALQRGLGDTEILPLYARLAAAEQHRVFQPSARRRVVLATNVAETSLTVPGIRYVVDPGTARISRYSLRTKVQRLPIEPISQASANQRAGRCGRVADGVCIRLYSEEDFAARPAFTDPEILRTNLASVILQMSAIGLGDLEAFPFIDGPDRRNIADGIALLRELGALDPRSRLTPLGRTLAQLPVDPRLARMAFEADRNDCLREVLVIVAALSIQDPRERPVERQQAADEHHARFADERSDFLTYLNLWEYLHDQQRALSSNQFRKLCRAEFLHYLRVREWQDLHSQLRQVVKGLGLTPNAEPADPDRIHQSLLAGLLSHVGLKDGAKREYLGARGARFAIWPGSALFAKPPSWVMAAELVETSRLWGRVAARIEPQWAERLGDHLVTRRYSEPHWQRSRGAVMAYETVSLYGISLVSGRKVQYARVDPALSRALFIRHALVEGDWDTRHAFVEQNRRLVAEVEDLEHRARRRDLLVDDETRFAFYDRRIGQDVVSARHFDRWWRRAREQTPDLLTFDRAMLMDPRAAAVDPADYPDRWDKDGLPLGLSYRFDPGAPSDGVTVQIPQPLLNQVSGRGLDWQVPGYREALVTALIRSLPKDLRRAFVPVPDTARAVLRRLTPYEQPLLTALARELRVPPDAWQLDRVPEYLRVTFDVDGERDRDLDALRRRLQGRLRASLTSDLEQRGLEDWTIGTLPRTVELRRDGYAVTAYPALTPDGDRVAVRLFPSRPEQRRAMWLGTRRLLLLTVPSPIRFVRGRLGRGATLTADQMADAVACAVDALVAEHGGPAWDEAGFASLRDAVRTGLPDTALEVARQVQAIVSGVQEVERRLATVTEPAFTDIRTQIASLVPRGFATATGRDRLPDVCRYVKAIASRLDKLRANPVRDRELTERVADVQHEYERALRSAPPSPALAQVRWMIEELRVSLHAQSLGTAFPVSEKRILRAIDEVT